MTEIQGVQIISLRQQGLGYTNIARIVNVSRDSVKSYFKCRGLNGYLSKGLDYDKEGKLGNICSFCGRKIDKSVTGRPKRFCCDMCRMNYWKGHREEIKKSPRATYIRECPYCKETFEAYGNKTRKFCCHEHYIKYRFYTE